MQIEIWFTGNFAIANNYKWVGENFLRFIENLTKMLIFWTIASYYYAHEYMYSNIRMMQSIRFCMNKMLPIYVLMADNSRKTILLERIDN